MERSRRTTALAPLTGILFVVLTVVSLFIAGEPPYDQCGNQALCRTRNLRHHQLLAQLRRNALHGKCGGDVV